jgi:glucose-6-phosphate 1-epimerase
METLSHVQGLNARFGITGVAQVVAGKGGIPVIRVTSPAATAEIAIYGAHVTQWKPAGGEEVLFLSEKSYWEAGHAIRGGIPVCFPWFGDKADDAGAPKHGFVRTRDWRLNSLNLLDDGSVTALCITESDASTRPMWPHDYCVAYRITIGAKLRLELTVINSGKTMMRFEEALHTYFRVARVQDVTVFGLEGTTYLDKTDGFREKPQADALTITEETDRVYGSTTGTVDVVDKGLGRQIRTEKVNSDATVVWNPWSEGAAKLADLGNDEWQRMIAVEAGNVRTGAIRLDPGEEHTMRVTISVASTGEGAS